jgi:protein SCO1/2
VAVAALSAALLLAGCSGGGGGGGGDPEAAEGDFAGTVLDPPFQVAGTPLTSTDGSSYSLVEDTDKPLTLVFFGYTNCPDICGLVMSNLATTMARLDAEDREQVDVVFVTTDPARDDAAVVQRYVQQFDDSFLGLTGDLDTIVDVAKPLGIAVDKGDRLPSGGYDVTHGTQVVGIDGTDSAPVYWGQDTSAAQFAADIDHLLSE